MAIVTAVSSSSDDEMCWFSGEQKSVAMAVCV